MRVPLVDIIDDVPELLTEIVDQISNVRVEMAQYSKNCEMDTEFYL